MLTNDKCDYECMYGKYNNDNGKCCDWEVVGDGECHTVCYVEEFEWDGGDCEGKITGWPDCYCLTDWINDGECDEDCNLCGLDGDDC